MKWLIGIAVVMLIAHYFFLRAGRRAERQAGPDAPPPERPPLPPDRGAGDS